MSPEERAEALVRVTVEGGLPRIYVGSYDTIATVTTGTAEEIATELRAAIATAIREAIAAEREACARVCDGFAAEADARRVDHGEECFSFEDGATAGGRACAHRIRGRR